MPFCPIHQGRNVVVGLCEHCRIAWVRQSRSLQLWVWTPLSLSSLPSRLRTYSGPNIIYLCGRKTNSWNWCIIFAITSTDGWTGRLIDSIRLNIRKCLKCSVTRITGMARQKQYLPTNIGRIWDYHSKFQLHLLADCVHIIIVVVWHKAHLIAS